MYVKDGIAYAGNPKPILNVLCIRPLDNFKLMVEFNDGTQRVVDMTPVLGNPAFMPLRDKTIFDCVYLESGFPMWHDGEIDIAPEWLYENGHLVEG